MARQNFVHAENVYESIENFYPEEHVYEDVYKMSLMNYIRYFYFNIPFFTISFSFLNLASILLFVNFDLLNENINFLNLTTYALIDYYACPMTLNFNFSQMLTIYAVLFFINVQSFHDYLYTFLKFIFLYLTLYSLIFTRNLFLYLELNRNLLIVHKIIIGIRVFLIIKSFILIYTGFFTKVIFQNKMVLYIYMICLSTSLMFLNTNIFHLLISFLILFIFCLFRIFQSYNILIKSTNVLLYGNNYAYIHATIEYRWIWQKIEPFIHSLNLIHKDNCLSNSPITIKVDPVKVSHHKERKKNYIKFYIINNSNISMNDKLFDRLNAYDLYSLEDYTFKFSYLSTFTYPWINEIEKFESLIWLITDIDVIDFELYYNFVIRNLNRKRNISIVYIHTVYKFENLNSNYMNCVDLSSTAMNNIYSLRDKFDIIYKNISNIRACKMSLFEINKIDHDNFERQRITSIITEKVDELKFGKLGLLLSLDKSIKDYVDYYQKNTRVLKLNR